MRALLSLVIAVVASALGHGLLWAGGIPIVESVQQYDGPLGAAGLLAPILATLGAVVIGAAMLTAAWSSLGVVVLGIVHLVAGTGMLLLPPAAVLAMLRPVRDANHDLGYGAEYSWATGVFLLTGVVYFVAGIAVAARRGRSSGAARAVAAVLAIVLGLGALPLVVLAGDRLVTVLARLGAAFDILGIGLLLGAAVVLAIVVATVRWSTLGVVVLGILLAAGGAVAVFAAEPTFRVLFAAGGAPLADGGTDVGSSGGILVFGMLLIAAGIAGALRAARRRRLEERDDADERIGYQAEQLDPSEQPTDDLSAIFPPANRV
jgi:hypothetical protein